MKPARTKGTPTKTATTKPVAPPRSKAARKNANKNSLASSLVRLEKWAARERPAFLKSLRPGLDDARIAKIEKKLKRPLLPELATLLRWHDGQKADAPAFVRNGILLPARDMLEFADDLDEMLDAGEFDGPGWWEKGWLPFFETAGGDAICVDTLGASGSVGCVVEFWHADGDRTLLAPDLASWFEALVGAFEAAAFRETEDENFEPVGRRGSSLAADLPGFPKRIRSRKRR